ncbi:dehydrogenase/reductase SDR family member 12 isoform X1 [Gracilaria domingensis]|nr:dehydrogenase/reductase SDR family member 12 isoform X1 [Gracilaria domingensis]
MQLPRAINAFHTCNSPIVHKSNSLLNLRFPSRCNKRPFTSLPEPFSPVCRQLNSGRKMQAVRAAQFVLLGYKNFGSRGFQAHQKSFNPKALDVDLSGKHYIVTGGTSGLGFVTAEQLAKRGGVVHIVCRNAQKGEAAKNQIVADTGNNQVEVHVCDISSLTDVKKFSDEWKQSGTPLHALVNNAGVLLSEPRTSEDGHELSFATNTLGTFVLTEMLRPVLERSEKARVVTVSSGGMLTENLELEDFEGKSLTKGDKFDGSRQYAKCKRRQVAMTEYWAEMYADSGIMWASMHPGWAKTPGVESSIPEFYNTFKNQFRTAEEGADTIVYLAAADEALSFKGGQFFFDRKPAAKHLLFGRTEYEKANVFALADELKEIAKRGGVNLPE